ncbi:envelope stress sensor histidine kinase CpxA [uncultured Actinobacillus sp.]|uniref:envelope stress sensor histidine kinase CpxA n=1 Tax=uncultured Actinobacillus sp. TaxID=417616 RepID=UPI0025EDCC61|nr:envelope stress sensor histidine kinase CpxA [uncultured Actinobacillus sp.]
MIRKIISVRNYLVFKLFIYFSCTFLSILFITFAFSQLDERRLVPIKEQDVSFLKKESEKVKKRFDLDDIFERDISIETPNGLELILVDTETDIVSGMDQSNVKPLLAFIYQTEGADHPMSRSIDNYRINGPFPLETVKRKYNAYYLFKVKVQETWLNNIFDNPLMMTAALLAFTLPVIFILSWRITRPLRALRLTANAVARGSLQINPKIERQGVKEFRDVGRSMNYMIASLEELSQHQQRLLSDISHELKTPLARLQLATAILKKKLGESNETQRIENEIQKMNVMVLDLLAISRQQVNQHATRAIFAVDDIWREILEDAKFETEHNNIALVITNELPNHKKFYINGNVALLASAMENIIRNAQKYTHSQINVVISLENENENENENERLIISVDDDGPGVPESELEQIFRPFYRVDEARARDSGGTGLGLAIVANAAKQHRGTVKAMKSPMGGLRVELSLPLWFE